MVPRLRSCIVFLFFVPSVQGEEAIDLALYGEPGNRSKTFVFSSESYSSGTRIWSYEGKLVYEAAGHEVIDDREYDMRIVETVDLPDIFPTRYRVGYRIDSEGTWTLTLDENDEWQEYLDIPARISVGDSWGQSDGFWSDQKLVSLTAVNWGKTMLNDCLEIHRIKQQMEPKGELIQVSIHCPGKGLVSTTSTHTIDTPPFQSQTTAQLLPE